MGAAPRISVVIATFDRASILRQALNTALRQDLRDIEVIVVGDHCTDDTAAVVAEFDDPRVRFTNLVLNFGDQSGPNNVGAQMARGEFLAFLNHDDLWFPDHLRCCLDWLNAHHADIVHSRNAKISLDARGSWQAGLGECCYGSDFDPRTDFSPVSCWLMRREVFLALKGMKPARELRYESSQNFLYRAWRAGYRHVEVPQITVLVIPSVDHRLQGSYRAERSPRHELMATALEDPMQFRSQVLQRIWSPRRDGNSYARRLLRRLVMWLPATLGIAPFMFRLPARQWLVRGRRINDLRRQRGLWAIASSHDPITEMRTREIAAGPLYELGARIGFGRANAAGGIKESGWAMAEDSGTWSDGAMARVCLRLGSRMAGQSLVLDIEASPYLPPGLKQQRVNVFAEGRETGTLVFVQPATLSLELGAFDAEAALFRITFRLPDARSPKSSGQSSDIRELGLFVRSLRLRARPPTEDGIDPATR